MELVANKAPYQRSKRTTSKIMAELLLGLAVIFVASVVHYFTIGTWYGLKALGMMGVSILVTLLSDVMVASMRFKGKQEEFGPYVIREVKTNYSLVTAVIFTLTLPIGTPYYVLILGNMFATLLVKYAFGGFGHNIFNPAALARLFVALAFGSTLVPYLGDSASQAAIQNGGLVAGATLTSQYNSALPGWLGEVGNIDLLRVFVGNYNGALGETFAFLIIIVGFVLALRDVLNWRTPVFYIGTIGLIAIPMALFAGVNVFESVALSIGLGGALFGAVFMLTDPVSSPTGNFGKALIGVIAAFFTVLIRVAGGYPEGVAFSIVIVNILAPMIDKLVVGQTTVNLWKKYTTTAAIVFVSVGTMSLIANNKVNANVVEESSEPISYPTYDDETGSEDLTPPYVEFRRLSGSYTSVSPSEYASGFTTNVEVVLDYEFNISHLEIENPSTPNYMSEADLDQFLDIYIGMSVKEFLALPAISETVEAGATQAGDFIHKVDGLWFSSVSIYQAIKSTLTGISVYSGSATSDVCDVEVYCPYDPATLEVDVYVKDGNILTVGLSETGQTSPTQSFIDQWEQRLPEILAVYQDLPVADFIAMSLPQELYDDGSSNVSAGLTFSGDRLFNAVQDALEGYGA